MNADNNEGPDREPRLLEIGEPEEIGSGEGFGVRWTLSIRPMVTEEATIPGLYIETDTGRGGGGGGSRGMNPAPDLLKVRMTALDPGLVAVYGPLAKWPLMRDLSVECADGTTRPGHVFLGLGSHEVDFFVAIVDREPVRVTVTTDQGGQWIDIDAAGFQYRVPDR